MNGAAVQTPKRRARGVGSVVLIVWRSGDSTAAQRASAAVVMGMAMYSIRTGGVKTVVGTRGHSLRGRIDLGVVVPSAVTDVRMIEVRIEGHIASMTTGRGGGAESGMRGTIALGDESFSAKRCMDVFHMMTPCDQFQFYVLTALLVTSHRAWAGSMRLAVPQQVKKSRALLSHRKRPDEWAYVYKQ